LYKVFEDWAIDISKKIAEDLLAGINEAKDIEIKGENIAFGEKQEEIKDE